MVFCQEKVAQLRLRNTQHFEFMHTCAIENDVLVDESNRAKLIAADLLEDIVKRPVGEEFDPYQWLDANHKEDPVILLRILPYFDVGMRVLSLVFEQDNIEIPQHVMFKLSGQNDVEYNGIKLNPHKIKRKYIVSAPGEIHPLAA